MKYYKIKDETLTDIADAIREKTGSSNGYSPVEMAAAIRGLETGGGAALNIAYGDTAPVDTSKLWIKCTEPEIVHVKNRFVATDEVLELGVSNIPTAANSIAAAAVDSKVYLFGGESADGYLSTVCAFDSKSNSISVLPATLPTAATGIASAAVGKKIYLFGGYNGSYLSDILAFDTETETIGTLSAKLRTAACGIAAATVGTKVYLFGGKIGATTSGYLTSIQVFDTESETISTLTTVLPQMAYGIAVASMGTSIYLFGGAYGSSTSKRLSTINVFDTISNTISTLATALPEAIYGMAAAAIGQRVYLFGGNTVSSIRVFDTETETLSTLTATLPTGCREMGAAAVGTVVYLFGGYESASYDLQTINKFVVSLPLTENHILIEASGVRNACMLLPTMELGVSNVYRGNAQGIAQKVSAALYKDGVWLEI